MSSNESLYYYDEKAAAKVITFFEQLLQHTVGKWAGKPFELMPYQIDFVNNVFGMKRKKDHTRRYRVAYLEIPKKNGKSAFASGLGLYLTMADREPGAQVYSVAGDKDQAKIIFDLSKDMVEESPELSGRTEPFKDSIYVAGTRSLFKVMNSAPKTKHGFNISGLLFDELHVQQNRELHDTLIGATSAREQPLTIFFTTAGHDRTTICYEYHDYAKQVISGAIQDDEFYGVIYAAPDDADWTDPVVWEACNPGYGVTVNPEYLFSECEKAKRIPARQNAFRRLHLNQWTEQENRWLSVEDWEALDSILELDDMRGVSCYAALDLSSTRDITALALLWPPLAEDDTWKLIPRFYMPEDNIAERDEKSQGNYIAWSRSGWLQLTPGNVVDQKYIRKDLEQLGLIVPLQELAFDRWNASYLMSELQEDGLTVIPYGQGFASMSGPSKELETLILTKKLRHDGNPVMKWMISNVATRSDPAGNIKPDKEKSPEKIDGVVATVMALGRAISKDNAPSGPSVYEERGIQSV